MNLSHAARQDGSMASEHEEGQLPGVLTTSSVLQRILDWGNEDDRLLLQHVAATGTTDWNAAAERLGVSASLAALRWATMAVEAPSRPSWTKEELSLLSRAYLQVLPARTAGKLQANAFHRGMSQFLPGRSASAVRQAVNVKLVQQMQIHEVQASPDDIHTDEAWEGVLNTWQSKPDVPMTDAEVKQLASSLLARLDAPAAAAAAGATAHAGFSAADLVGALPARSSTPVAAQAPAAGAAGTAAAFPETTGSRACTPEPPASLEVPAASQYGLTGMPRFEMTAMPGWHLEGSHTLQSHSAPLPSRPLPPHKQPGPHPLPPAAAAALAAAGSSAGLDAAPSKKRRVDCRDRSVVAALLGMSGPGAAAAASRAAASGAAAAAAAPAGAAALPAARLDRSGSSFPGQAAPPAAAAAAAAAPQGAAAASGGFEDVWAQFECGRQEEQQQQQQQQQQLPGYGDLQHQQEASVSLNPLLPISSFGSLQLQCSSRSCSPPAAGASWPAEAGMQAQDAPQQQQQQACDQQGGSGAGAAAAAAAAAAPGAGTDTGAASDQRMHQAHSPAPNPEPQWPPGGPPTDPQLLAAAAAADRPRAGSVQQRKQHHHQQQQKRAPAQGYRSMLQQGPAGEGQPAGTGVGEAQEAPAGRAMDLDRAPSLASAALGPTHLLHAHAAAVPGCARPPWAQPLEAAAAAAAAAGAGVGAHLGVAAGSSMAAAAAGTRGPGAARAGAGGAVRDAPSAAPLSLDDPDGIIQTLQALQEAGEQLQPRLAAFRAARRAAAARDQAHSAQKQQQQQERERREREWEQEQLQQHGAGVELFSGVLPPQPRLHSWPSAGRQHPPPSMPLLGAASWPGDAPGGMAPSAAAAASAPALQPGVARQSWGAQRQQPPPAAALRLAALDVSSAAVAGAVFGPAGSAPGSAPGSARQAASTTSEERLLGFEAALAEIQAKVAELYRLAAQVPPNQHPGHAHTAAETRRQILAEVEQLELRQQLLMQQLQEERHFLQAAAAREQQQQQLGRLPGGVSGSGSMEQFAPAAAGLSSSVGQARLSRAWGAL